MFCNGYTNYGGWYILQVTLILFGGFPSLHLGPDREPLAPVLGHHEGLHGGPRDDEVGVAPRHFLWGGQQAGGGAAAGPAGAGAGAGAGAHLEAAPCTPCTWILVRNLAQAAGRSWAAR